MAKASYEKYSTTPMLIIAYHLLFGLWLASYFFLIPVPVNLIVTSSLIIYIGCHRSLALLQTDEKTGEAVVERETLTKEDAMKFPIIGSLALGSLYVAFKYLDKDWVNFLLSLYFSVVGTFTLTATAAPLFEVFLPSKTKYGPKPFKLPVLGDIDVQMIVSEIIALIPAIIFSYFYFKTKHFMMNNVLGISFCVQTIERVSLGSYKIGAILLTGLFFYDIFWVFGTEVMVTVAKSFDGPIKLLFRRSFETVVDGVIKKAEFSLLGLGDIVVPGLFIAILMRFDAVNAKVNPRGAEHMSFPKPFFTSNIIGYCAGLLATVLIMYYFNAAQPALLYLVPACLGASLIMATATGKFNALCAYDEESPTKDTDNSTKKNE
jgi:minor histocompatibility antigen H13